MIDLLIALPACANPVPVLERSIAENAAQIAGVDRITGDKVELYLAALGLPLSGEDALTVVMMGDEALLFGIQDNCVLHFGKVPIAAHRAVMRIIEVPA